ncbi:hypothetical protein [Curtobacterium sp. MCLR17_054]|uniref:hypothetical protein n=1 Tax=Curtobacterium sp. MCLR17_054 TaxID=2175632 RepID=UPI000DA8CEF3|nr:hypothetical protein [Curtobacterium sp. MCLR17_054]WIE68592.1 hypothetical protein DEJ08_001130 [Curtobacterium sp. MCLR17_054]
MSIFMEERFRQAGAASIDLRGTTVWAILDLPPGIARGRIVFEGARGDRDQGMALDAKGSTVTINHLSGRGFRLWTDTAPPVIEFAVDDPSRLERMRVWNVWRSPYGSEDAWTGNFGMIVEQEVDAMVVRCSNGLGDVDFEDFRFRIEFSHA